MSTEVDYTPLRWQSHDGLTLEARDYAPATPSAEAPIVCIPGLTRSARDFDEVAPWLAKHGRRVIVVNLRGRGPSGYDPTGRSYKPATYVRDMQALLKHEGLEATYIIGTSLGGLVAMGMASANIRQVAGVVLNDIGPAVDPAGLKRIASYAGKTPPVSTWTDAVAYAKFTGETAFPDFKDADWKKLAKRTFRVDENGGPAFDYDPKIFKPAPAFAIKIASFFLWRKFRHMASKRPTLVLRGAISDVLSATTVQQMHDRVPTLTSKEIPGVGHAPTLDEPESRNALSAFFLS
ncbi:alpha/beta fold hydrolase [Kordiimonas sp.]|uniref:alpha/beta fold hydrolase n=1 Tax=Kordiimonas sp. TaxID=1970157 RepID=UPI003A91552C